MRRFLIQHIQGLDNYGTGMMGLVTIQALVDRYGAQGVEIYADFTDDRVMEQVGEELRQPAQGEIRLHRLMPRAHYTASLRSAWMRRLHRLYHLLFSVDGRGFDALIVLGGDDFSEYYGRMAPWMNLFRLWKSSFCTRVILLGQTLGPFEAWYNRMAVRWFLPRMEVWARDPRCVEYMSENFNTRLLLTADLALSNLPRQGDVALREATFARYGLHENGYFTVVVSAGQSGGAYYCRQQSDYLNALADMIIEACAREALRETTVVLLAHTFGRFGDEPTYIENLFSLLPSDIQRRTVVISEQIMPTRARFILGRGLFTLTGRMHAAVSTLQGARPAICLSYSTKFRGVIGACLGQGDLIIEADDDALWTTGEITAQVSARLTLLLSDYATRCDAIRQRVDAQQALLAQTFTALTDPAHGH